MTPNANVLTSRATPDEPPRAAPPAASAPPLSSSQLRAFVNALKRLGYDVTSLLTDAGIRRAELDDPDGMIPSGTCDAILGRACEQRRHPNLSAHLAAVTPIGTYPLLDVNQRGSFDRRESSQCRCVTSPARRSGDRRHRASAGDLPADAAATSRGGRRVVSAARRPRAT